MIKKSDGIRYLKILYNKKSWYTYSKITTIIIIMMVKKERKKRRRIKIKIKINIQYLKRKRKLYIILNDYSYFMKLLYNIKWLQSFYKVII